MLRNDIKYFVRKIKKTNKKAPVRVLKLTSPKTARICILFHSLKSQNFDGFLGFFVGSENPSVRGAHCTFEIALSGAAMLTLMLVCAFLHVVCFILDQTIVASDKCLSYARMLLFPTGT